MQDDKTLQQLLKDHEANLPPEILDMIKSFDWRKEVRTIVNQNQLMIDVGADIEESVYLMLLGVVTAQDFYERLVDVHEIPDDKARKIIEETEAQIFNPMYKKMMELDGGDKTATSFQAPVVNQTTVTPPPATSTPISSPVQTPAKPTTPRDEMLAEIEKEPEPLIKINFAPKEETATQASGSVELDGTSVSTGGAGITKPFTLSPEKSVQPASLKIETPEQAPTQTTSQAPAQTTEAKPVDTALTKPTVTEAPKPRAVDPYREPIE